MKNFLVTFYLKTSGIGTPQLVTTAEDERRARDEVLTLFDDDKRVIAGADATGRGVVVAKDDISFIDVVEQSP